MFSTLNFFVYLAWLDVLVIASTPAILFSDGTDCVAPALFTNCIKSELSVTQTCLDTCSGSENYAECVHICTTAGIAAEVPCYIQYCWNQVYSCAYQYLFNDEDVATLVGTPFFPPSANAPGSCSCSLNSLYEQYTTFSVDGNSCTAEFDKPSYTPCLCCAHSGLAAIGAACPGTDISAFNFTTRVNFPPDDFDLSVCTSDILAQCPSIFSDKPAGGTFIDPATPIKGTKALSNVGSLTMFPAGSSIYVAASTTYTLVPATGVSQTRGGSSTASATASTKSTGLRNESSWLLLLASLFFRVFV